MCKEDLTLIVAILDRSGSMEAIKEDAIGGFNSFLEQQKEVPGDCQMSIVLFDHEYNQITDYEDVQNIDPLNERTFVPRGCTALFDAVGSTIQSVGEKLDNMPEEEKPSKVLFLILTDGDENASKEYDLAQVKTLIQKQQDEWNWEFVYLAADADGFNTGLKMGLANSSSFDKNNTRGAYSCVSNAIADYRSGDYLKVDKEIN